MLSIVLFIATAISLLAGIALFVFDYAPYIADFFNSITQGYIVVVGFFPDFLAPYALVPVAFAIFSLLVKLL